MKKSTRFEHITTLEIEHQFYKGFLVDIVLDTRDNMVTMWLYHEEIMVKEAYESLANDGKLIDLSFPEETIEFIEWRAAEFIPDYIESREEEEERFWKRLEKEREER